MGYHMITCWIVSPSTLQWLDLRLCYTAHMTRVVYEYDVSLLNGYRRSVQSPFFTITGQREEGEQERREEVGIHTFLITSLSSNLLHDCCCHSHLCTVG